MKKILILDDDKNLCSLMQELFLEGGASETVTVNSLEELKSLAPEISTFDLFFLDVNLGENAPSGLDAFDWLKAIGVKKRVIFFTGHAQSYPLVQKALKYDNVSVLQKPTPLETLENIINS